MKYRTLSMILCIICIALILISSGLFYLNYSSNVKKIDEEHNKASEAFQEDLKKVEAENDRRKKESYAKAEEDARQSIQEQRLQIENRFKEKIAAHEEQLKNAKQDSKFLYQGFLNSDKTARDYELNNIHPKVSIPHYDLAKGTLENPSYKYAIKLDDSKNDFKTTLIIHGIIIAFLILAEIGLLVVLPKKTLDA